MGGRRATRSSIADASMRWILLPKIKLELVVTEEMAEKAIQAIINGGSYGASIGDGKIFVSKIDEAIRIRNDERGEIAL